MTRNSTVWPFVCLLTAARIVAQEVEPPAIDAGYDGMYQNHCAVCHGDRLQGAAQGTPLVGVDLVHGDSFDALSNSIS